MFILTFSNTQCLKMFFCIYLFNILFKKFYNGKLTKLRIFVFRIITIGKLNFFVFIYLPFINVNIKFFFLYTDLKKKIQLNRNTLLKHTVYILYE